jgi:hypothetical protein
MLQAVAPLAFVLGAIRVGVDAETLLDIVFVLPLVLTSIWPVVETIPIEYALVELTIVFTPVLPPETAESIHLISGPVSLVA